MSKWLTPKILSKILKIARPKTPVLIDNDGKVRDYETAIGCDHA